MNGIPMRLIIRAGDILDERVDALICSANPQLNMSGGVNGEVLLRGGQGVQRELHDHLARSGRRSVEPGTIVRTSPGPLPLTFILHAVAVDAMYRTSIELVERTIERALEQAAAGDAKTVALVALATGFGRMTMEDFASALGRALVHCHNLPVELRVVVRRPEEAETIRVALGVADPS